jgi:Tol biopolymer transport system component
LKAHTTEAGEQFEKLYSIYRNTYNFTLPQKTEVMVLDGEITNGFAQWNTNTIAIWCHDLDFNLRGTHEWLRGVCSHEFAHIVSLQTAMKTPGWLPMIQFGYFSHPNEANRIEALHVLPTTTIPPWFAEGIAQYEDSRHGTDSWDTHRDMILRTLTLSNTLNTWDHISVFAGKSDDYEKTYNHGFSLITYIANHYGYDKVVSLLRQQSAFFNLDFDCAIKSVLGISGRQLYKNWSDSLKIAYTNQVKGLGKQVYGKKLNKNGFDNYWPKFSADGKKLYFVSNGKQDYSFSSKLLYSYNFKDTSNETRIKVEKFINGFYSIDRTTGRIVFTSMKSPKSTQPAKLGGNRLFDVFVDTLGPDTPKFSFFPKTTEHQITEKRSVFSAVFSPSGNKLACAHRDLDKFYIALCDTNGKNFHTVYPKVNDDKAGMGFIYSLDWSPDGHSIAISYLDAKTRKVGIYDTLSHTFTLLANNNDHDDRDPRFSPDGSMLYFSSDRTGIFNIYRYTFSTQQLESVTNVSGGAFAPDVSPDNKKLAYANYDAKGYGIYCLDTIKALKTIIENASWKPRDTLEPLKITTAYSQPRPYSGAPRKLMLIPTFITEGVLTNANNPNKGLNTFKAGVIADIFDPFAMLDLGTEITGYFLVEPSKLFNFITPDKNFINPDVNYDFGLSMVTHTLPLTLKLDLTQRGLAGNDYFYNETDEANSVLNYGLTLRDIDAIVSHPLGNAFTLYGIASYNWYDVFLETKDIYGYDLPYTLAQGARVGLMLTFLAKVHDAHAAISPRGLYAKLRYNLRSQQLMNDEQSFKIDTASGTIVENYDTYGSHDLGVSLKFGMPSPWYSKHDIYLEFNSTALMTNKELIERIKGTYTKSDPFPSYYMPVEWIPGYVYYYPYTATKVDGLDTTKSTRDSVLVTGSAVAMASASYRFPLWPKSFDTKLWFLYFDKLYGAINFSTGAGWNTISDMSKFRKQDWLSSAGLEVRLQAKSFDFPMAIKVRWDRGLNRAAPIGGDRITLGIGFSFDNWEYIEEPDYGRTRLSSGSGY